MSFESALAAIGGGVPTDDTADVVVSIDGVPLAAPLAACVQDVRIAQQVGHAAHLTLHVAAWDSDLEALSWVDDRLFEPGRSVEVSLGYLDHRRLAFAGEIVGLELDAHTSERAVLTVTAYDLLHRLGRGQRTTPYPNTTCAQIARQIADRHGLQVTAIEDRTLDPERALVDQKNLSDLALLLELAAQINYEVFVEGKRLVFRKSRAGEPPEIVLDARRDLVSFSAVLDASSQLGGVDVIGFDSSAKEPIKVSIDNPGSADRAFGPARTRLVEQAPISSQTEADSRAKAALTRMREQYLTAQVTCLGRTDLRPNINIEIDHLGARFSGTYYIESVTHSVSASAGFRTSFHAKGQPR